MEVPSYTLHLRNMGQADLTAPQGLSRWRLISARRPLISAPIRWARVPRPLPNLKGMSRESRTELHSSFQLNTISISSFSRCAQAGNYIHQQHRTHVFFAPLESTRHAAEMTEPVAPKPT